MADIMPGHLLTHFYSQRGKRKRHQRSRCRCESCIPSLVGPLTQGPRQALQETRLIDRGGAP